MPGRHRAPSLIARLTAKARTALTPRPRTVTAATHIPTAGADRG